jgi:hypothetical protein
MLLVCFRDCRKAHDVPPLPFKDMPDKIVLMQPLHDQGARAMTAIV